MNLPFTNSPSFANPATGGRSRLPGRGLVSDPPDRLSGCPAACYPPAQEGATFALPLFAGPSAFFPGRELGPSGRRDGGGGPEREGRADSLPIFPWMQKVNSQN
eukprot:g16857.t1